MPSFGFADSTVESTLTGTVMVRSSPGGANQMRPAPITAASKHRIYGTSRLHEQHLTGTVMVGALTRLLQEKH